MKKLSLSLTAVVVALCLVVQPYTGFAGPLDDINRKLENLQKQEQEAAKKRKEAEELKASLQEQKRVEIITLQEIQEEIERQVAKLNELNEQVNVVTAALHETTQQLVDAEERVEERDKQLKSRVRAMYMNGTVSYLDVILSATSFSDFIERFNTLKLISGNDKRLLEANKKDRDLIAEKKIEVEIQLQEAERLYAEAEDVRQQLLAREKQKEVAIASLSAQEAEAEGISEEQEQSLVALAKEKAQLYNEKNKLIQQQKAKEAKMKTSNVSRAGGQLAWPVPDSGIITSEFGYRIDPIAKKRKLHAGMDIAAPNGTTIVAADDGVVLIASWVRGYGNTVVIDHGGGMWTWYGHIRENGIKVSEGDSVTRGQKIAEVGSTGDSTGNHLHFEVRIDEKPVNPRPYVE